MLLHQSLTPLRGNNRFTRFLRRYPGYSNFTKSLNRLLCRLLIPRKRVNPNTIRKIRILIHPEMGYGNAILLEPFIRKLRRHLPDSDVFIDGPKPHSQVFVGTDLIDGFAPIGDSLRRPLSERLNQWKQDGVDTVIESYFPFLKYPQRSLLSKAFNNFWFGRTAFLPSHFRGYHETEEHFLLLKEYADIDYAPHELIPKLHLTTKEIADGKALYDARCKTSRPLIGLHLGSSESRESLRRWPVEYFVDLARNIENENDTITFAVFGTEAEKSEAAHFLGALDNAIDLTSLGPFRLTGAVMKNCAMLIANDSGLMHLANAVGIPVLGIFGPTIQKKSAPLGPPGRTLIASLGLSCQPCYWRKSDWDRCENRKCLMDFTPKLLWENCGEFILRHIH